MRGSDEKSGSLFS